jgi:hypothetical protein
MTVAQCGKKLYRHCLLPSINDIWENSGSLKISADTAAADAKTLHDVANYLLDYIANVSK